MTRTFTFEEIQQKLLNTWPDFGSGSNEWMELARRVYDTLFSEHARAREKRLHKSIEIATLGKCFHQLRRDRRNEAELRAAWSRGERTYKGKHIMGGATCPYLYRWERDEVMEVVEMIEQVLREEEEMTVPMAIPQTEMASSPDATTNNPKNQETNVSNEIENIKTLWAALQVAEKQLEKRGLPFGQALYEYRGKSEVVQGGTTFRSTLDKLGIPHSTAYVWIDKYAASIGMKKLRQERVQHRAEGNFDQIKTDALEIVKLGQKALLETREDTHPVQAAKDWAMARLKSNDLGLVPSLDSDKSYAYFEQFKEEPQTMGDELAAMLVEFGLDLTQIKEVLRYAEMNAKRTLNQMQTAVAV
jgi:hypothetical protein